MLPHYKILLDGSDVETLSIDSCQLSLRSGGPDTLSLAYQAAMPGTAPHAIGDIVVITAEAYDETGALASTTTLFSGRVTSRRAADQGGDSGWSFTAENGWGDLRRVVLTQNWESWDATTEELSTIECARVLLGQDDDGDALNSGEIITFILNQAASKGARVTVGTISPALEIPPTEVVDTSCDQALRQILNYHPDHVAWIEGATALQVRPPSALSTTTVDPCADGLDIEIEPQTGDVPAGVIIVFERTHTADGRTRIERIHQTAGEATGWPPPLLMTIPLAGIETTTKTQEIETRTIPAAGNENTAAGKLFYKGLIPQIADALNDDLGITGQALVFADPLLDDYDGTTLTPNAKPISHGADTPASFPRMLVAGQVEPWMGGSLKQYDAIISAKLHYRGTDPDIRKFVGAGLEISEPIQITNALPKVHSILESVTLGEEPITGLAASYWSAIQNARNEGSLSGELRGQFLSLRPGRRVIATGYFSEASVITQMSLDCLSQSFTCNFGGSEYLNPKTLTDLARAIARNRPKWTRPTERTEADAPIGNNAIREGSKPSDKWGGPKTIKTVYEPWAINGAASGEWSIIPGTIGNGSGDYNGALTCSNPTVSWTLAAGDVIAIKIDDLAPSAYTLEKYSSWPISGSDYVAVSGSAFDYRLFPLWEIESSAAYGSVTLGTNLFARRLAPPAHLQLFYTWHYLSGGAMIVVPDLNTYAGAV